MSTRLIALAMAAVLLAGCQGTAGPTGSPAAPDGSSSAAPAVPAPSEGSGAASGAPVGSGEPASEQPLEVGPEPAFGTATFTVDASKAASVHYPADSGPAVVSATDGSGATWTLTIPEGALERPATITMTPLASVTSFDLPGPVLGGVLLEPEGTSFAVPATLTVTGGPTHGAAAVLTGDEAGLVRLAVPAGDAWGTVAVTHFSPWYSADPEDLQWSKAFSDQERDAKAAAEEARQLLKRKLNVPDAPSIPWKCRDDSDWKQVERQMQAFYKELVEPEYTLIERMLRYERSRQILGLGEPSAYTLEKQLAERVLAKALKVLEATKGQPDTIMPVAFAVLRAASQAATLGASTEGIVATVAAWAEAAIDKVIGQIREGHDYAQSLPVWEIARLVQQMGGNASVSDVEQKLAKALAFDAVLTFEARMSSGPYSWVEEARIPLRYSFAQLEGDYLAGAGTGKITSYRGAPGESPIEVTFPVNVRVRDVGFCEGKATLMLDRFYIEGDEHYRLASGGTMTWGATWMNWTFAMQKYLGADVFGDGPAYRFPVELRNKDAEMVDDDYDGAGYGSEGTFTIVLEHKPAP